MKKETWKDVFCDKLDDGKTWKNIFKEEFDKRQFLDRSDAVYICKKAQADVYEHIIDILQGKVNVAVINKLKLDLEYHWKKDDSALGRIVDGKQINR